MMKHFFNLIPKGKKGILSWEMVLKFILVIAIFVALVWLLIYLTDNSLTGLIDKFLG